LIAISKSSLKNPYIYLYEERGETLHIAVIGMKIWE